MTPVEMCYLATFLASKYPSARVQESSPQFWRALLAEVDDIDALIAFIRLVSRKSDIALADVCTEAYRIQTERLARYPESDSDPNQARHYGTEFPAVLTSLLGRRVACPWCGAARGQACVRPGSNIPLRRTPAHPARLIAAGLAGGERVIQERLYLSVYPGESRYAGGSPPGPPA
jgi:hypothetical protein